MKIDTLTMQDLTDDLHLLLWRIVDKTSLNKTDIKILESVRDNIDEILDNKPKQGDKSDL